MNKLLFIFLIVIAFLSCQGGKNKQDTLKASVEKFKDSLETIEIVEFIPKAYSEVKIDTILNNGFSVHIKTYTNMKDSVNYKYKLDAKTTHLDIYRHWVSEVKIVKNDVLIFDEIINNDFLLKNKIESSYLKDAVNIGTKYDEALAIEKDYIYLFTGLVYPGEEGNRIFNIKIDGKGNYNLYELKT